MSFPERNRKTKPLEPSHAQTLGVVICSVAAFGAGCCWCLDVSHNADVPNLAVKQTEGSNFSYAPVSAPENCLAALATRNVSMCFAHKHG